MAAILGRDEILHIKVGTGAGSYKPIGCLTSNGISHSADITEGTKTKCDLNPAGIPQDPTYEVSFDAIVIDEDSTKASYDDLYTKMTAKELVSWKITRSNTDFEFGKGYITALDRTADVDSEVGFTGTITGVGTVSKTEPAGV